MTRAAVAAPWSGSRPRLTTRPMTEMTGRTSQPVSRSMTTEATDSGRWPPRSRETRAMRSTSPPMVVGNTLETNWPAK